MAKECQGCRAKYALVRVKFQSTGANLGENVSEARVVFLLGRPPHDNIVLRVGASWEVCNNGGYFCLTSTNTSLAECIPKGRRLNRYRPKGVPKVRRSALSSSTLTCQYPDEASILEKY